MTRRPSFIETLALEYRTLPFRRFVKDMIYWRWVSFWIWAIPSPLWALTYIPFMAGCRGYFEWRDGFEYPQIGRWYSQRWHRWRRTVG